MTLRKSLVRSFCVWALIVAASLSIKEATAESNTAAASSSWSQQSPPPPDWPPPPPPPGENLFTSQGGYSAPDFATARQPIHYPFPSTTDKTSKQSARRDPITRFQSQSAFHKLIFRSSCATVGAGVGTWLGRSVMGKPYPIPFATLCLILSFLRGNVYGELIQALGMLLILSFQRFQAIRKRYPAHRYLWASIGLYQLEDRLDRSENRLYVLAAMGLVGSFVGGSVPLIPTSLGSLAGGLAFALSTLQPTVAGDFCYCMGLRLVALAGEMGQLNTELGIVTKGGAAASKMINTILVFDRKHRVQEKLGSFANWVRDRLQSSDEPPSTRKRPSEKAPRRGGPPPRRPPPPGGPPPREGGPSRRPPREGAPPPRPLHDGGPPPRPRSSFDPQSRPPPPLGSIPPRQEEPKKKRGFFSFGKGSPASTRPPLPPTAPPVTTETVEPTLDEDTFVEADMEGWDFVSQPATDNNTLS